MRFLYLLLLYGFLNHSTFSQTILNADGPGNTYELINSILAPEYDAVEVPDCSHQGFGRHIDEIFDPELNRYVFRFYIHTSPDNDRCLNYDRQRNEIKSYDQSPDSLIATENERVEYRWFFKLDSNFQSSSSFTHIHQIKAVGGPEQGMPLFTLTTRKGTPDKLQLRYAAANIQSTLHESDLMPLKGVWVEVVETILYGEIDVGEYSIAISKVSDGTILFSYSNVWPIRTWKTDALFLRPKWGIYRSLNDSINLRDEEVLFADFFINELNILGVGQGLSIPEVFTLHQNYPNPFNPVTTLRYNLPEDAMVNITIYDMMGRVVKTLINDQQTAGYWSLQWNATNDAGQPVSAGLYLYTIQAGEFRQTKKMVLLK